MFYRKKKFDLNFLYFKGTFNMAGFQKKILIQKKSKKIQKKKAEFYF